MMRCPSCQHEMVDNTCFNCGYTMNNDRIIYSSEAKLSGPLPNGVDLCNRRYRVLSVRGTGGMGRAYIVQDNLLKKLCIIKEFDIELGSLTGNVLEQAKRGFIFEAQTLATLKHENMPAVWDYFEKYGRQYFVSALIDGKNLMEISQNTKKKLDEKFLTEAALSVLKVLKYVHSLETPVIHRDIKPENIMYSKEGKFYLIDFGAARSYIEGKGETIAFGTQGYAAPEAEGAKSEPKSDIFSLGMSIYVLATGKNVNEIIIDSITPIYKLNPEISKKFSEIVQGALEIIKNKRYDAREMETALLGIAGDSASCWWCNKTVQSDLAFCPYCKCDMAGPEEIPWSNIRADLTNNTVRKYNVLAKGEMLWNRIDLGSTQASPLIIDSKLIMISSMGNKITALEIKNGNVIWEISTGSTIVKTGTLVGSYAFFPTTDDRLIKVFIDDGRIVDNLSLSGFINNKKCTMHLANNNNNILIVLGNRVMQIQSSTGELEWFYDHNNEITSIPVCIKGLTIFGDSLGSLVAIGPNGNNIWKNKMCRGSVIGAVVYSDGLFYASSHAGETVCFYQDGSLGWVKSINAKLYSAPCIINEKVIVAAETEGLIAYSALNGQLIWKNNNIKLCVAAPLAFKNIIVSHDYKTHELYLISMDGRTLIKKQLLTNNNLPVALHGRYIVTAGKDGSMSVFI